MGSVMLSSDEDMLTVILVIALPLVLLFIWLYEAAMRDDDKTPPYGGWE